MKTIEDLDLSVRAYNILRRAHIDTVEQLQQLSDDDLLRLRNMGTHIVKEIREKVAYVNTRTNGDRIRAMVATDEGIAKILLSLDISLAEDGREFTHLYCDGKNGCITEDDNIICTDEMRTACIQRWLQQPAKEE